tara:strand:+ start:3095 stop:4069 length:975 start_codon:yes stop_codon:yes gene_type:complete
MGSAKEAQDVSAELTAAVISVHDGTPKVLTVKATSDTLSALPAGPLTPKHRTLQAGVRSWVESLTGYSLGHVEQLYTFGDGPVGTDLEASPTISARKLSIAYLALVSNVDVNRHPSGAWNDWYSFFPWEDTRTKFDNGEVLQMLHHWAYEHRGKIRHERIVRLNLCFGLGDAPWDEERAMDRYELLYEAGVVEEAHNDGVAPGGAACVAGAGLPMMHDHRRILATAMSRLRAKIKYRPVLFELMPSEFTLLQLQRTCETLSGINIHKQNFRRLVMSQGLVEETNQISTNTGGRPAKLMRFRGEVIAERPAPGVRVRAAKRGVYP